MNATFAVFLLGIVAQILDMVMKAKATASQNKEWTVAENESFDAKLEEVQRGMRSWWNKAGDPS